MWSYLYAQFQDLINVPRTYTNSGAGSARFSYQLCTSGNKFDTFNICFSNLPDYKINSSQRDFFHFQDGYHNIQNGRLIR